VEPDRARYVADVRLARAAANGSVADWHEFVLRYSGLMQSVVRRYLLACDDDTQRSAYVDTLESLFRGGLARYDGNSSLATWVITITRSRCLDSLRATHGRKRLPRWLRSRSARDQEIYRLYFVERLGPQAVAAHLARLGHAATSADVEGVVERFDAQMDRRQRSQLAYELRARSVPRVSARLLQYLDHARLEAERRHHESQPDAALIEADARDVLDRLRASLVQLPERERRALELRFGNGLTERAVAAGLGLPSRRSAQIVLLRALALMRRILSAGTSAQRRTGPNRTGGSRD
jgi:DNA-directed RNA polymerase specialized sigma24 family protein